MVLLQAIPGADQAADTLTTQLGAVGAMILIGVIGIFLLAKWLMKREAIRQEYNNILTKKQEERYNLLIQENKDYAIKFAESNASLINILEKNTEVIKDNTEVLKKAIVIYSERSEVRDLIKEIYKKLESKAS